MLKTVFGILTTTPDKIRRELIGMSPREIRTRPASGKWSVQEIVAHLEDVEQPGFRGRIETILGSDHPLLPIFDQEARAIERRYDRSDPKRKLESWARQRRANLKWLRALTPRQLKRTGRHEQVGDVSISDYIHEWAFHDLGHLRQILEVKRYALYPQIGNMRAFYRLT